MSNYVENFFIYSEGHLQSVHAQFAEKC